MNQLRKTKKCQQRSDRSDEGVFFPVFLGNYDGSPRPTNQQAVT